MPSTCSNTHCEAVLHVAQHRSKQMFNSHSIQAILQAAGLIVTVRETQRAGHATKIVKHLRLDTCDAIVTVGGDGTVFEALQVFCSLGLHVAYCIMGMIDEASAQRSPDDWQLLAIG